MSIASRRAHGGFTLVELMVSLAIGLAVVLAMLVLLANTSRNNGEVSKSSRLVENGRFALQILGEDLSHAGYWGGFVPHFDDLIYTTAPDDVPAALPDPCLAYTVPPATPSWTDAYKTSLVGVPVQGYDIPSTVPTPTLSVCSAIVLTPKANTDVLFVRHANTCAVFVSPSGTNVNDANCPAYANSEIYFQANRCGTTSISPSYVVDNASASLTMTKRDCTTAAEIRRYVSNLYYVRNYAATPGDGIPTLMRSQFGNMAQQAAQPLVEGVEGFRVEYGIDNISKSGAAVAPSAALAWADANTKVTPTNRGDGIPDGSYVRCTTASPCTVDQMMNVVAVKVYVLMRAERATSGYTDNKTYTLGSTTLGPFNDGFKRQLYVQTIRLQNMSSRREVP